MIHAGIGALPYDWGWDHTTWRASAVSAWFLVWFKMNMRFVEQPQHMWANEIVEYKPLSVPKGIGISPFIAYTLDER